MSKPAAASETEVTTVYVPSETIFLRPEEFADDAENKLGRANGNTYQRKNGVDKVHDGQIMVRLKKKRFIIIDYGYVPKAEDYEIAKTVQHISIPDGAGERKCATPDCPRIGVPVLLYDSEPNEPTSLYLRGGICFGCQRLLNEKRRTQRKRKSDGRPVGEVRIRPGDMPSIGSHSHGNVSSRFRYNDQIVELNPDAVVINGPVEGTRLRGPDYRCTEIGSDLLRIVSELSQETLSLMQHSSGMQAGLPPTPHSINQQYQKAFLSASRATFLLTQWKASYDAQQQAAQAAVAGANFDSRVLNEAVSGVQAALGGLHHGMGMAHAYPTNYAPVVSRGSASAMGGSAVASLMMPTGAVRGDNDNQEET